MSKIDELKLRAIVIKEETNEGANTADRVGGLFYDIIDSLENAGGTPDKPYDPTAHSGLGKKTLKLKEGDSNVLTQEDFNQENTIYIVSNDFDLNGASIQIPAGSVLDFEGGSVNNGKLVSNSTIITGDYRGNALYGVYLNSLKDPMSYNYKQIKTIKASIEHGYTPWITDTTRKRVGQSIAAFKYNNIKYIATFHVEESDASGGIYLFDEYYNFIKYVTLQEGQLTHFNDATVKGTDILVADCLATSYGIRRISISNLISAVDGGAVASDKLSICSDKTVVSIDYDNVRHELAVLDSDYTLIVYDDNNEIVSTTTNINEVVSQKIDRATYQGMIYKNGQITLLLWATQLTNYTTSSFAIPIIIDLKTKNVFIHSFDSLPYSDSEIEGICKDPDNDSIYWSLYHMWLEGSSTTSRNAIVKHSFDEDFEGVSNHLNIGSGQLGDGTYINIAVDCNGSNDPNIGLNYVATGSALYPFKTLDSAILCRGFVAGRVRYYLRNGDYYIGKYNVASKFIHFLGNGINNTTIHGVFTSWDGYIDIDGATVINDYNSNATFECGEASYIRLNNVKVTSSNRNEIGIILSNSDAQFEGVTIDNVQYCFAISGSYIRRLTNLTIKDCDYVFLFSGNGCSLGMNPITNIIFDERENDTRKLISKFSHVIGGCIKQVVLSMEGLNALLLFASKRLYTAGAYDNTACLEILISGDLTGVCKLTESGYVYSEDKEVLEEGEFRVNISRGFYYYNGWNIVCVDGRKTIFKVDNPNYQLLPKGDMEIGDMYFDNDNNIPALYKGSNSWLKLLTSRARSFTGSLNDCREQGMFYFAPTGDKPDLGGVTQSEWYYVLNIGRDDICQIIAQNLGTKIGMRYYLSAGADSHWTDWIIFESASPDNNNVENG